MPRPSPARPWQGAQKMSNRSCPRSSMATEITAGCGTGRLAGLRAMVPATGWRIARSLEKKLSRSQVCERP